MEKDEELERNKKALLGLLDMMDHIQVRETLRHMINEMTNEIMPFISFNMGAGMASGKGKG